MKDDQKKNTETGAEEKNAPRRARGKKKNFRHVTIGRAYVQASYNNTMITFTDPVGNVLGWSSAGSVGFTGPKKATPYASSMLVRDATEKIKGYGLRDVHVLVRGVGSGREGAIRALNANGLNVLSIKDVTPIPHNGCRAPKPRRV